MHLCSHLDLLSALEWCLSREVSFLSAEVLGPRWKLSLLCVFTGLNPLSLPGLGLRAQPGTFPFPILLVGSIQQDITKSASFSSIILDRNTCPSTVRNVYYFLASFCLCPWFLCSLSRCSVSQDIRNLAWHLKLFVFFDLFFWECLQLQLYIELQFFFPQLNPDF